MNPGLVSVFERSVELFGADPRVIAAYHSGSVGNAVTEDQYSDVDPVFIIKDDEFDSFDADLPGLFAGIDPNIALWWPESSNCEWAKNYAILIRVPDLVQYDINFIKASRFTSAWVANTVPEQVIFDKAGILARAIAEATIPRYSPEKLRWHIERWWLYAYINVKYLRRGDMFKLFFVQQTLLDDHLHVMHALNPDTYWEWWPINVKKHLSKDKQLQLGLYFTATDKASLIQAIEKEMDVFSKDAREACRMHGVEYPAAFEAEVRQCHKSKRPDFA